MNTKHTPGPWFGGVTLSGKAYCIIGDGDSVVCEFPSRTGSVLSSDARLIAASPDLLAKLADADAFIASLAAGLHLDEHFPHDKRCEYGGGVMTPDWKSVAEMRQEIAEVIARATGEQA